MTELRVYLRSRALRRQFAAYMGSPTRARGYVPLEGMHSLIVEIAPALAIHRVIDLALKSVPEAEPGMLYVERQFGILELHSLDMAELDAAGAAILDGIGAAASDQLRPQILYTDIVDAVTDQHAVILNRNREASMILPGECLLLVEDGAGPVRRRRGQRGGERRAAADAGRLPDDRRLRPRLPVRPPCRRRAGARPHAGGARNDPGAHALDPARNLPSTARKGDGVSPAPR